MRQAFHRTAGFTLIAILLAACGTPQVTGVVSVEIPGGDRQMPLDATMVLAANVVAGSGTSSAVSWESSDESVAAIDGQGVLTALTPGETIVTATSTADPTISDAITVTVVVQQDKARAFDAVYVPPDPSAPPVLAASLAIASAELIGTASLTEVTTGLFLGPLAPVGPDGSVSVTLPAPADIPAEALEDVTGMFPAFATAADCELVASSPTTKVTPMHFSIFTFPGVILSTIDSGLSPAVMTDTDANPVTLPEDELEQITIYLYLYADGNTTVTSVGSDCNVDSIIVPFSFDLELVEGWSQVAVVIDYDATHQPESIIVTNGSASTLYLHPLMGL